MWVIVRKVVFHGFAISKAETHQLMLKSYFKYQKGIVPKIKLKNLP